MQFELDVVFKNLTENRWNWALSSLDARRERLLKLKKLIIESRVEIAAAIYQDFKKPIQESELTEIHTSIDEINFALKNIKKWMRPKKVGTPITLMGSYSRIYSEARGVSLIMAPWNYPFYLVISPLVSAISAGCVAIIRPSEKAGATSLIIEKILKSIFNSNEIYTALGDIEVSKKLLDYPFDHIFYTGSTRIGKIVMEKASKHLTSVTLELGGKSPVIIDQSANLEDAVSKIIWGKMVNAGQTCVAPDYVFVPKELNDKFCSLIKIQIEKYYGETSVARKSSPDFARLIDDSSFIRLRQATENTRQILEDTPSFEDNLYFPPTVLFDVLASDPIMQQEIFGPILPILTYENINEVINHIQSNGKPLALYLFSNNKKINEKILRETSSGGVVINHVVCHLGNAHLPFGGVGTSGMGSCHGEYGFKAFSHEKAVLIQGSFTLTKFYFPPYQNIFSKLAFKLLQFLE